MCSFTIALSYISKHISQAQFNYSKISKKNTTRLVSLRNVEISSDTSRGCAQTVRITSYGGGRLNEMSYNFLIVVLLHRKLKK